MEETRESKAEQPELQVINFERRPILETKSQVTGREYRRMLRKAAFAFGVSLGVNIAQAIMIYILQVGPI
ncbi:MAG TPA: hypothetical protein H9695_11790 [Candidatus Mediterraneibacter excrementigallinarum]|nr:hypothetical protein [Candidatus Mediterraneibacter excrementigallinarum]